MIYTFGVVSASGIFTAARFWYDMFQKDAPYCTIVTACALAVMTLIFYEFKTLKK